MLLPPRHLTRTNRNRFDRGKGLGEDDLQSHLNHDLLHSFRTARKTPRGDPLERLTQLNPRRYVSYRHSPRLILYLQLRQCRLKLLDTRLGDTGPRDNQLVQLRQSRQVVQTCITNPVGAQMDPA